MANVGEKTRFNIFYKARSEASKNNEQLGSRSGASDMMCIDQGRLYRIESGVANPYPEEIRLMANLYNAPELENYYCTHMCPLGYGMPKAEIADLDRISLVAIAAFRKLARLEGELIDITEDGIISEDEKPALERIIANLEELGVVTQNLKIWARKNLREMEE